jgi:hypothetical protein
VEGSQVWLQRDGDWELVIDDLVEQPATHREVRVTHPTRLLRQGRRHPICPAEVEAGGSEVVLKPLRERVAHRHERADGRGR